MLKVIIADDEEKVCNLIYHLIDWTDLGLEVVAIVNDGKKAYDAICEKKPDIVITDIRMPIYDGITLVQMTKEILPNTSFIIVSGYSQFEFAQSAIKYGVEDYLLKPLKKKELLSTLHKINEKRDALLTGLSEREELKILLHTSEEKAKKSFLAEILFNPGSKVLELDKDTLNKEFYCRFSDGFYAVLIIKPFIAGGEESKEINSLLLSKIQCIINEKLLGNCKEFITTTWEDQIICLINVDDSSLYAVKKQLGKMKIDVSNLKAIFQNVSVVVGIGKTTEKLSELHTCVQQAQTAILNRVAETNPYIIEYSDTCTSHRSASSFLDSGRRNVIMSSFELLDIDSIVGIVNDLERELKEFAYDGQLVYDTYCEFVDTILFGAKNFMSQEFPDKAWFQSKYRTYIKMEDIFENVRHQIRDEFDKYANNKLHMDSKPIRQAKQYIIENYNINISLESVSSLIGLNPAYFSSLFKKETGENFMEYIMKIRIQNAKYFLLQTNKDIAEIAADIGYMDIKYFSKLFKKITGLSPSEFRKIYG